MKMMIFNLGLVVGLNLALGSVARADVVLSSGYYDLSPASSGGGPPLPSSWLGSPNTNFYGSSVDLSAAATSDPDISALLLQNTGSSSVVLSGLTLSLPMDVLARATAPNGNLPLGDVTLLPGQNYIFAVGDGSDTGLVHQTISLTINGSSHSFADATTSLAPDGVLAGNMPQLGGGDETQPWTKDGTISVPEPNTLVLIAAAAALFILRRKYLMHRVSE